MFGKGGGSEGVDETFAHRSMDDFGAFILGSNMFGPVRGEWLDDSWKGWWGDNPPYHAPTFVLTHHAREPIVMEDGTTFHFVTDGIHAALERARDAARAVIASSRTRPSNFAPPRAVLQLGNIGCADRPGSCAESCWALRRSAGEMRGKNARRTENP